MRATQTVAVVVVGVVLTACSGPLVSERFVPQKSNGDYRGTAHGLYCLPKQYLTLNVMDEAEAGRPQDLAISLSVTTGPDLDHLYRLGFDESVLSTDTIHINYVKSSADAEGAARPASCLLANVTSDVTDATPTVVKDLTRAIFKLKTGKDVTLTSAAVEHQNLSLKRIFEVQPDKKLLNDTAESINAAFAASGFRLRVKLEFVGAPGLESALARNPDQKLDEKNWGVFGRIAQPYRISLYGPPIIEGEQKSGPLNRLVEQRIIYSHNGLQPFFIQIDRAAFVQRKTTIDFRGGYPTKIETDKKSEMEAFAQIPLDIVTGIVGAPVAALQSDAALIKKQGELIDERQKVIEAQKALDAERKKGADKKPDGASGGTQGGGDPGSGGN